MTDSPLDFERAPTRRVNATAVEVMKEATAFTQSHIAVLSEELLARKDCQPPLRNEASALQYLETIISRIMLAVRAFVSRMKA